MATPENVAFRYEVAGPFTRVLAAFIDVLLLGFIGFVLGMFFSMIGAISSIGLGEDASLASIGIFLLIWFLISWFYSGVLETFWSGRTVGKYCLSLRVLTKDGRPINGIRATLRNFFRLADFMPPFLILPLFVQNGDPFTNMLLAIPTGGVAVVVMAMNRRFQRIGDLVAGTIVIHEKKKHHQTVDFFSDPRVPQLAEYIPASFMVSNELSSALSLYVERREYFSPERTNEIASHLGVPLLEEFGLPADTSHDLLLCALYYRTFLASENRKEIEWQPPQMPPTAPQYPVYGQPGYGQPAYGQPMPQPYPQPTPNPNQPFGSLPPGYGPNR